MLSGLSVAGTNRFTVKNIGKEKKKDIRKDNGDPARQQTH